MRSHVADFAGRFPPFVVASVASVATVATVTLLACGDGSTAPPPAEQAGPAVAVVFQVEPNSTASSNVIAPVAVRIVDASGRTVGASNEVSLSLSSAGRGASGPVLGTTVMYAAHGVAWFGGLHVSAPGAYRLHAASPGLVGADSRPFRMY